MMGTWLLLTVTLLLQHPCAQAAEKNTLDDRFAVKVIEAHKAILEGTPKNLKEGDTLYYMRSPFQFRVQAVKGDQVTIALPEKHELAKGTVLLRYPTAAIQRSIDAENRLKKALEE
jgi:hypothetical protein